MINQRLSIAPMMDCTDRHFRQLMRLISQHVLLYTEMITAPAIIHGNRAHLLGYDHCQHPLVLQVGGSDPEQLARSTIIAAQYQYDEINLNVGCPSSRVQSGAFGACLMKTPKKVADCVSAMRNACQLPVTVKTRIGVDDHDSYDQLCEFIETVANAGCDIFTIHARKAWLQGLSPKENREIPPLSYETVYRLKKDYPHLTMILNGGVTSFSAIDQHLQRVDGVMVGRAVYSDPYWFAECDQRYFGSDQPVITRTEVLQGYWPYVKDQYELGVPMRALVKPIIGLFQGQPGAKQWRRTLSERLLVRQANLEDFETTITSVM